MRGYTALVLSLLLAAAGFVAAADLGRIDQAAWRASGHASAAVGDRPLAIGRVQEKLADKQWIGTAQLFADSFLARMTSSGTVIRVSPSTMTVTVDVSADQFEDEILVTIRLIDPAGAVLLVHREELAAQARPDAGFLRRALRGWSIGGGRWIDSMGHGSIVRLAWRTRAAPWEAQASIVRSNDGPERVTNLPPPAALDASRVTDPLTWGLRLGASRVWSPLKDARCRLGANVGFYKVYLDETEFLNSSVFLKNEHTEYAFAPDLEATIGYILFDHLELQAGGIYRMSTSRFGVRDRNFGGLGGWAGLAWHL